MNTKDNKWMTPLHRACASGSVVSSDNSEFTQQDGGKKRTAKRLCVTNVTGLLRMCFVVIFT